MNSFTTIYKTLNYSKYSYFRRLNLMQVCKSRVTRHRGLVTYSTDVKEENEEMHTDSEDSHHPGYDYLYSGHIPTTRFQKTLLAIGSGITAIVDPARDDMVSAFGETTGYFALQRLREKMLQDPVGRQILEERPILNSSTLDIEYLGSLPENTFGKHYWNFLNKNGFSPDARLPVQFVDDEDLQYVMLRYRQIHDLFHTVLGMPPHMLGEVIVKMVETFQTGLPMCALAAMFGPVRLGPVHRQKYFTTYLPWAIKCGSSAKFLMAVYYEKHWEQDLQEFRRELNIIEPPPGIGRKKKNTENSS
ncbi:ubiquinone biosynthesis protein COQ4 homolog, mitochondrial [Patella vulgata]|uniref:ubiquinone biosynthesis protein COQ4 homolog, mitochondrial n=1 Tax=Patella vulgata TaxID=6465 RepID=UPI0021806DDF|nr:ubiquinone biosynthesis protein COQ4 homolog, mitochondrial [Patella vulgata]